MGGCQGVAIKLLECFGWLPGGFYKVARVLWVVEVEFSSYSLFNLSTDIKVISFETSMF